MGIEQPIIFPTSIFPTMMEATKTANGKNSIPKQCDRCYCYVSGILVLFVLYMDIANRI